MIEKCNFCYEKIDQGLMPVCIEACPVQAIQLIEINKNREIDTIPGFKKLDFKPSIQFILPDKEKEREIIIKFIHEI